MSIVKKVNGKPEVIANISVIDHNQLANRNGYGCHSISAIRKLPEKLSELKSKQDELEATVTNIRNLTSEENLNNLVNLQSSIEEMDQKSKQIDLDNDQNGDLIFTNYDGESKNFKSGKETDNDTISLKDDKISLNKVYTDDTLTGIGTQDNPLSVTTPVKIDNKTISKTNENELKTIALEDGENVLTASNIKDNFNQINNSISELGEEIDSVDNEITSLKAIEIDQNDRIYNVEARTTGMGGYLDAYNFGKHITQQALTNYALQNIGIENQSEIFNGTKVINTYDKHTWALTNTPDSDPPVFNWADLGVTKEISVANDKTYGLVRGSTEDYEGSIDTLGHISINGLSELDRKVLSNEQTMLSNFDEVNHSIGDISDLQITTKNGQVKINSLAQAIEEHEERIIDSFDEINNLTGDISDLETRLNSMNTSFLTETILNTTTGVIRTFDLDNTTFNNNINEILKYINNSNGGGLISLCFKTGSDNINAEIFTEEEGVIDTETSPVLIANSFYYLTPKQVFVNGNNYKICFECQTSFINGRGIITISADKNTTTHLFENASVTLSGESFYIQNNKINRYYFQNINILNEQLAHLTINYAYYPDI